MKLLQLNTWGCRLDDQVVALLRRESADIACLQETFGGEGHFGIVKTVGQIAEWSGYDNHDFAAFYQFKLMHSKVGFGNAVVSSATIEPRPVIFTSGSYSDDFDYNQDDYNARNLQHVVVATEQGPVHVFNHHGYHVHGHKNGTAETLAACKMIADAISTVDGPVIVAGDFNLVPGSESIALIEAAGMRNLSSEFGLNTTRNYLTPKTEVCDYIFVNDKVTVEKFTMLDDVVSDHNALVLEFSL